MRFLFSFQDERKWGCKDLLGADMMGRRTRNAAVKGVFHSRLFILVSLIVVLVMQHFLFFLYYVHFMTFLQRMMDWVRISRYVWNTKEHLRTHHVETACSLHATYLIK